MHQTVYFALFEEDMYHIPILNTFLHVLPNKVVPKTKENLENPKTSNICVLSGPSCSKRR